MPFGSARGALRLAVLFAALALPATASATLWVGNGEGESDFKVSNGALVPSNAPRVVAPSDFSCNTSNLYVKPKRIPLANGKIDFSGNAYADYYRHRQLLGRLTWRGTLRRGTIRFQTPKTASYRPPGPDGLVNKPCDTGVLRYCPRPPGGAAGGPGACGPPVPCKVKTNGTRRRQSARKGVTLKATSNVRGCHTSVDTDIIVPVGSKVPASGAGKRRAYHARTVKRDLDAGRSRIKLKLSAKIRRAVADAVKNGRRPYAISKITARNSAGAVRHSKVKIYLRR